MNKYSAPERVAPGGGINAADEEKATVAVAGATGYAGQELVRLLARHPSVALGPVMASRAAADGSSRRLPALARVWDGEVAPLDVEALASAEAVFLATPDGVSAELAPALVDRGTRVFDLSGAFRLTDDGARAKWYPHSPALPAGSAYGLPELNQAALRSARFVACAGCYPTAALLALQPLRDAGLLAGDPSIVIDAKSGVSGAGKTPSERTHFSECHGNVAPYGIFSHRHGAEIEQELGAAVTFVPHLVPLDRGILETIYARLRPGAAAADITAAYDRTYGRAPFIRLRGDTLPEIKHVAWTNFCDLGWRVSGDRAVVVSAIDNLLKGAAGQAVQAFNVAFGFEECAGLL
jgi:N-acetyl-gamma-glutamyl-phosphate reductase